MSIYCTLWEMKVPRDGWAALDADEWVQVYAQGVPRHIQYTGPEWDWLPPPVPYDPERDEDAYRPWRAVFICADWTKKGTPENGQQYVDYLLMLAGEEYATLSFDDLWERITDIVRQHCSLDDTIGYFLAPGAAEPRRIRESDLP